MLTKWSKRIQSALFPTLVTTLPEYALPTPDRRLSKSNLKNGCITPSTAYPHITTGHTSLPRYIPRGPNFGPRPRSTRWPKRVPRCRALLGGFSRARRIGPSGLRGEARGRCRPRRERIAPTATPRPTPRRRKSATRCGSPCQCSPCCNRCFSTLPKNIRRRDHGAERRALNSISNQIDLRKIHWLANPGKVIRGARSCTP